jgi:hypothetical protein
MSRPPTTTDAMLVVAIFSRHEDVLEETRRQLEFLFGPIGLAAAPYDFHHTRYYEPSMGADLKKQLLGFSRVVPLDSLVGIKRATIDLEAEIQRRFSGREARVVNIDPGLLNLGKFMLATTKDQAHRLYFGRGIFAEVTLRFADGEWEPWPWTYADYREPEVRSFLKRCREYYKKQLLRHSQPLATRFDGHEAE